MFLGNCVHVETTLPNGERAIAEVSRMDGSFEPGEAVHVWWNPSDELSAVDDHTPPVCSWPPPRPFSALLFLAPLAIMLAYSFLTRGHMAG